MVWVYDMGYSMTMGKLCQVLIWIVSDYGHNKSLQYLVLIHVRNLMCFHYFFSLLCHSTDSDKPLPYELPNQWLWDIIDEFLYQVQ